MVYVCNVASFRKTPGQEGGGSACLGQGLRVQIGHFSSSSPSSSSLRMYTASYKFDFADQNISLEKLSVFGQFTSDRNDFGQFQSTVLTNIVLEISSLVLSLLKTSLMFWEGVKKKVEKI